MAFTAIKRAIMNAKFRKVNKHYATDYIFGERTYIPRKDKDPVEVLLYYPSKMENMPVFVQIHGGAWVGMDAVDDDRYCLRLSKELGALVVNVNYKRLYEHSFPYAHEEIVDTVKWLKENAEILCIDPEKIVLSGGSAGAISLREAASFWRSREFLWRVRLWRCRSSTLPAAFRWISPVGTSCST